MPWWFVAVGIAAATVGWADEEKQPWSLRNAVDLVGKEFVDPRGAVIVEFEMMVRGLNGAAGCGEEPDSDKSDVFAEMARNAMGEGGNHLANAAWLELAGRHEEAGKALELAHAQCRDEQSPIDAWRNERAWFYFAGMVHAFMQRKDAEWAKAGRKQDDSSETTDYVIGEETFFAPDERRETVAVHAEALRLLEDRRIAATLALRADQSSDPAARANWAFAADHLDGGTGWAVEGGARFSARPLVWRRRWQRVFCLSSQGNRLAGGAFR